MLLVTSGTRASADTEKSAAAVRRAAAALVLCVILKTFNACIDDARSTSRSALLRAIESNFSYQLKPILKRRLTPEAGCAVPVFTVCAAR